MHTGELQEEEDVPTKLKGGSDFGFQMYFYRPPSPSEKEQEETIIKQDKALQLRFKMP
jgi:hypothetical protein